jgi:hypothetical protein
MFQHLWQIGAGGFPNLPMLWYNGSECRLPVMANLA